jgi:hypothetical protein
VPATTPFGSGRSGPTHLCAVVCGTSILRASWALLGNAQTLRLARLPRPGAGRVRAHRSSPITRDPVLDFICLRNGVVDPFIPAELDLYGWVNVHCIARCPRVQRGCSGQRVSVLHLRDDARFRFSKPPASGGTPAGGSSAPGRRSSPSRRKKATGVRKRPYGRSRHPMTG